MKPRAPAPKDLVVLVADIQQEKTIAALLETRHQSLRIRKPTYDIFRHAEHDPGIFRRSGNFLNVFVNQYHYALVILDAAWEGCPVPSIKIVQKIQNDININGWQDRSAVVVIDPELEIWVWSDSPHIPRVLGVNWNRIRELAYERNYWREGEPKPYQPKELLEDILEEANKRRTSAIFEQLAKNVGLEHCQDANFIRLREILQMWFPLERAYPSLRERRASYKRRKRNEPRR